MYATAFSGNASGLYGTAPALSIGGSAVSSTTQPVGSNNTKIATTAFVQQALVNASGIEWNTQYVDVSALRAKNVVYANTTEAFMLVNITLTTGGGSSAFVNGIEAARANAGVSGGTTSISFIVAPGGTYSCNSNFALWSEMRS
jgi:hypothetical protein